MTNANALPIQERLRDPLFTLSWQSRITIADRIDVLEAALREAEVDAEKWRNQEKMLAVYFRAHCDASPPEGR